MTGADIDFYQSDSESRQDQEEEEEKKEDPLHPFNIIAIQEDIKFYTKNLKSSTEHPHLGQKWTLPFKLPPRIFYQQNHCQQG